MANSSLSLCAHTHTYVGWKQCVVLSFKSTLHWFCSLNINATTLSLPPWLHLNQSHKHIVFWTSGLPEWRQTFMWTHTHSNTHTLTEWRQAGSSVLGQYWTQTLSTLTMSLYKVYSLCICVGMYTRTIRSVLVYLSSVSVFPSHRRY